MIIQSKRVWLAGQFMPAQLIIKESQIYKVMPYGSHDVNEDYGNKRILPGFIDIHTHGAYGFDTNDGNPEGLRRWLKRIPEEGVTAILPTTITQSIEVLEQAVKNVATVVHEGYEGAEVLGINLEGPFLSMKYKGAQPAEYIVKPSIEQFEYLQMKADNMIKMVTVAPEEDDDHKFIRYCCRHGIAVSIGHSNASYDEVRMAIANGASSMTHVFNAMSPLHHRHPGVVGAALRMREIYGEIICDGNHVSKDVLNSFFMAKGSDHGIMVSDSLLLKGMLEGYEGIAGGNLVILDHNGAAKVKGTDTLAGSTLKINEGLRILVEEAMVPFEIALNACSINPARLLKADDRKGCLSVGYDADIVVLNDDYSVEMTYTKGRKAF